MMFREEVLMKWYKYGRRHINVLISVSTQVQLFTESHKRNPEKVGVECMT